MELFLQMLALFVFVGFVAPRYVNGVHRLGAWIVAAAPVRLVKLLSMRLWRTHWDDARQVDEIGLKVEDRTRKRIPR